MRKETTSDRLKQIMSEKGLRQVDILDKVKPFCEQYNEKINKSHLSQWVSGINEPNQRKLTILAKALNVSETWLMGYDFEENKKDLGIKSGELSAIVALDAELQDMIEKYLKLSDEKKASIRNMINLLSDC